MLAATARALGTCWIGHGQKIGLPKSYQVAAAIIFGYPALIPEPPKRNAPIILSSIMN